LLAYYFDIIGTVGSKTCSRVNECKLNNGECSQICVDTYDSYYCACHDGYELAENTYNCPCKSLRFPYDLLYLLRQYVGFIPVFALLQPTVHGRNCFSYVFSCIFWEFSI